MLKLETHKQFEKDVKKSKKRGKDLKKLWDIVNKLLNKKKLSAKRNSRQKETLGKKQTTQVIR